MLYTSLTFSIKRDVPPAVGPDAINSLCGDVLVVAVLMCRTDVPVVEAARPMNLNDSNELAATQLGYAD